MTHAPWRKISIFCLLVLAVVVLYAPTLSAPWLPWDDDNNIFNNAWYAKGEWLPFWTAPYYGLYIPLTSTVWGVLFKFGEGATWPFRIFNLALHLANVALVMSLVRRFYPERNQAAWVVGALFAFHPVQVGTVAWISGGRDLLAAFLALSATRIYVGEHPSRRFWSTGLFVAALLAKPHVVTLPVALWLLTRERFLFLWMGVSGVLVLVTTWAQKVAFQVTTPTWFRPFIMLDSFGFQMQKLVWPTLALDYGRLPAALFANPSQLLGTALVALMAILACVFLARRFPSLRWGWGYFLLMLPVSGIVNTGFQEISTVVDHYQYLPLVAVGLILVPFVDGRRATLVALVLAVVAAGVARSRLSVWTDEARFYRDMIERNPNSFSAAIGLGNLAFKKEDPVTAAEWYQRAIVQRPYDVVGLSNYAAALYAQKKFSLAYELRSTFSIPAVQKKMLANPVPTASFLTSVGSSAVELGHLEEGFKYICESARMIPENERFQRNVETVESLLKKPCPWRR